MMKINVELLFQSKSRLDQLAERFLRPVGFLSSAIFGQDSFKIYCIQDDVVKQTHYPQFSMIRKFSIGIFCAIVVVPATIIGLVCKICFALTKENCNSQQAWHNYQLVPPCDINKIDSVAVQEGPITTGQGEYLIFRQSDKGEVTSLTPDEFAHVFPILNAHSPTTLVTTQPDKCADRYRLINNEIEKIDATYRAVFIPKTFYELMYIEKCIEEDLNDKQVCPFVAPPSHNNDVAHQELQKIYEKIKQEKGEKCWHDCYFTTHKVDSNNPKLTHLAYRLNQVGLACLQGNKKLVTDQGIHYSEWLNLTNKKIDYLKEKHNLNIDSVVTFSGGYYGPTGNFCAESQKVKSMGIRNEADEELLRNAVKLDCSEIAKTSVFLYRGGNFQKDSIITWNNENIPYSLSYGTSALAGSLFDGGATALYYMRNEKNAYAIPVPLQELAESPFFVPNSHTVAQLCSDGEVFHVRTKAWSGFKAENMGGFNVDANGGERSHLGSSLDRNTIIEKFNRYKTKAIQLK